MSVEEQRGKFDLPAIEIAPPLKPTPLAYSKLRVALFQALGYPKRNSLIIGIDGRDGQGKSSLANWLAWQLGMSAISLDHFLIQDSDPLSWRVADLSHAIQTCLQLERPVIVEGVFLQDVLEQVQKKVDYLVLVKNTDRDAWGTLQEQLDTYLSKWQAEENADFTVKWSSKEYDDLHLSREMQRIRG
jgi:pantothenate kinase-related protein Tda10